MHTGGADRAEYADRAGYSDRADRDARALPSPGLLGLMGRQARGGWREVAARAALGAAAALSAAGLLAWHDPGVLCPLRRLTGVPCPACGSTTVFTELGGGHPLAALAANPATVAGGLALLLAPLGLGRRWWALPARRRNAVLLTAAALSWLWQLHRYGFL
jgi:hypothetical protein